MNTWITGEENEKGKKGRGIERARNVTEICRRVSLYPPPSVTGAPASCEWSGVDGDFGEDSKEARTIKPRRWRFRSGRYSVHSMCY